MHVFFHFNYRVPLKVSTSNVCIDMQFYIHNLNSYRTPCDHVRYKGTPSRSRKIGFNLMENEMPSEGSYE